MTSSFHGRRPASRLFVVLALIVVGLTVAPRSATAASVPQQVMAGEPVTVAGGFASRVKRPVTLQRYVQRRWSTVAKGRTSSRGTYSFTVAAPAQSAAFRVVARRVTVNGTSRRARISKVRRTAVVTQRGTLTTPSVVVLGRQIGMQASFVPARGGRPVRLEQRIGAAWVQVAVTRQDAGGRASFSVELDSASAYRAVALPWRGAAARATAVRDVGVTAAPDAGPWVTGYYAGWFWDQMYPPQEVDMTAMTHLVFGRVAPGSGSLGGRAGTVVEGAGTAHDPDLAPDGRSSVEDYLVGKAHDAGTKALLMLGGDGGDGAGFVRSAADGMRADFVEEIVDYLVAHDYDGVDVDWENCLDGARDCGEDPGSAPVPAAEAQRRLLALLTEIRAEAATRQHFADEPVLITFPGYPVNLNFLDDGRVEPWQAEVAQLVDQYNLMSYGIGTTWSGSGWQSWFSGALSGATARTPVDIDSSIAAYVATGVPRGRLGIGIGFYGIYFGSGITGPRQDTDRNRVYEVDDVALSYHQLVRKGYLSHGEQRWDEEAQSTYRTYGTRGYVPANDPRSSRAGFLSYEDARSIAAKGRWVKDSGVGGTIVWTLNYGWLPDRGTNPLLAAVKRAFIGGS